MYLFLLMDVTGRVPILSLCSFTVILTHATYTFFVRALDVVAGDGMACSDWRTCEYVMGGDGNGGVAWIMVSSRIRWR